MNPLKLLVAAIIALLFSTTLSAQVNFSANFENGSIGEVKLIESKKIANISGDSIEQLRFYITTKADPDNIASPTLTPSKRWFHFLITGVKGKEIILDINYNDSKIPVYSYDGENFTRFTNEEVPQYNKSITKRFDNDSVYIAYFTPYTQSYLNKRIAQWHKTGYADTMSIGHSEQGREMTMLTITNKNISDRNKKIVYIHGRVHPSETPSSWHLDKMIDLLTSNLEYAKDLRDNAVFYILPFTNPDGVYNGMSRSNVNGINLEVNWADQEEVTAQEVKNMRRFLQNLTAKGKPVDMFLNMHSQIAENITYWIHTAESTSNSYYKELMLLSNLTINGNPYFKKNDLSFSKVGSRYLEGWFWDNFGEKTLAATFETPYTYYNKNEMGVWVTVDNLKETAINNLYAIGDYLGLGRTDRVVITEPKNGKRVNKLNDNNHFYFGNSYLVSKKEGAVITFKGKNIPQGEYEIYIWSVGENLESSNEGENEWKKIDEITQQKNGNLKYKYISKKEGEKIDNILLLKKNKLNRDSINVQ